MRSPIQKFTGFYGGHPLHLLGTMAAWAMAGYVVMVLGPQALWNPRVWWQSIAVWFLAAVVAHDLILFPLYTLADRVTADGLAALCHRRARRTPSVPALNYLRIPSLAAGLSLLLFFPGIVRQGHASYLAATGQTQQPFLARWLLLVAALYGASALAYATRIAIAARRGRSIDDDPGA